MREELAPTAFAIKRDGPEPSQPLNGQWLISGELRPKQGGLPSWGLLARPVIRAGTPAYHFKARFEDFQGHRRAGPKKREKTARAGPQHKNSGYLRLKIHYGIYK